MKITLIARSMVTGLPESVNGTEFSNYFWESNGTDADDLAHFAGRSCYQSWHMPNPDTADARGYIGNIIAQGHFSVLEHASATFYVEGVSRNLTHELVRHRHLSYSELSQRFVDMSTAKTITPPALMEMGHPESTILNPSDREAYTELVDVLLSEGYSRKQAREAARFYLPNNVETKIVVTGNMRAWRDMLHKRYSVHADAEIREFATLVLAELRQIAPASFQDFPDEPFS